MRRILWWFRKELREQRAFLVILALAIPLASWVVVYLGRGVPEGPAATAIQEVSALPHRMDRNGEWAVMLLVSLGLVLLAVPGGLFASDTRRGCNALTARTPGAWTAAFGGKLMALLAIMLATLLVHGIVLGRLAVLYRLTESGQPVDALWLGPSSPDGMNAILGLFALAPLLVLASVALPWLGVPTVAGAAIAAVLVLPTLLGLDSTPFFLEAWLGGPRPLFLVAALSSLGIAMWTWFRSVRRGASARRVAFGSLVALAIVALGTHGVGWAARERYRDFTPGEPDVEFDVVGIGPNGHFAFVNAYRSHPSPKPLPGFRQRGTRSKPFILDLRSGVQRATGGSLLYDFQPQRGLGSGVPSFVIPEMPEWGPGGHHDRVQRWYDADTAELLVREEFSGTSARTTALARLDAALRAHTRQRTKEGRPVWIGEGGLTHVGWQEGKGEVIEARPLELALPWSRVSWVRDIPGGWELSFGSQRGGWEPTIPLLASVHADTGVARHVTSDLIQLRGQTPGGWLSPRELLTRPVSVPGNAHAPSSWRILDLDTKQTRSVPEHASSTAVQPLAVVDGGRVLSLSMGKSRTLAICELATGAVQPVRWDGVDPGPIVAAWVPSRNAVECAPGPLVVVDLYLGPDGALDALLSPPAIWIESSAWTSMPPSGHPGIRHAIAVFDGASGRARLATQEVARGGAVVLGLAQDGALWLLEDARRIVRYGPAPLQREVLFPRER